MSYDPLKFAAFTTPELVEIKEFYERYRELVESLGEDRRNQLTLVEEELKKRISQSPQHGQPINER